jgi:hypothetical protein
MQFSEIMCSVTYLQKYKSKKKSKAIPVTRRGGLSFCEMLRIPHCQDNRLIDGGDVVSLTHRPLSTNHKYYYSASGTNFCYRLSKPQGLVRLK